MIRLPNGLGPRRFPAINRMDALGINPASAVRQSHQADGNRLEQSIDRRITGEPLASCRRELVRLRSMAETGTRHNPARPSGHIAEQLSLTALEGPD